MKSLMLGIVFGKLKLTIKISLKEKKKNTKDKLGNKFCSSHHEGLL